LGAGFLEKVYENAMIIELRKLGLNVTQQVPLPVYYEGQQVGEYFADLLIEDVVVCELKANENLSKQHEIQLVNYLAASRKDVGLLINFGSSVTLKRKAREYQKK
jgi:GxxExxY protein